MPKGGGKPKQLSAKGFKGYDNHFNKVNKQAVPPVHLPHIQKAPSNKLTAPKGAPVTHMEGFSNNGY